MKATTLQDCLRFRVVMLVIVMLGVQFFMIPSAPTSTLSSSMAQTPVEDRIHLPADYFTENAGQLRNEDIRFYSSSGGMQVGFAERSVLIKIVEDPPPSSDLLPHGMSSTDVESTRRGVLIRITFQGANPVQPQGRYELSHRSNFFLGNDPSKWKTDVRSYREIVYENLYEAIDLVYHMGPDGLKYDFIVHPGGDPALIRMAYEGLESLDVNPESLVLRTETGEVRDEGIVATAGDDSVRCEFARRGNHAAGFNCAEWDPAHLLVIDPLLWATFLGGGGEYDRISALALDTFGDLLMAGWTYSADFPATPGAYDVTLNGSSDAFVAKLSADGSSLLWATFLGGGDSEGGSALALDAFGDLLLAGNTKSANFPATPGGYDVTLNGLDTFVAKLSADGSSLLWATFLGGNGDDGAYALAFDAFGDPIVGGWTTSADFPVTPGAYDVTLNGSSDAFVAKLSADGSSLLWATFLGGNAEDGADILTLDAFDDPIVGGWTYSADFPVTPSAYDTSHNGGQDAFVVKLKLVIVMPDLEVTQGDISLDPPGPVAFATDVTVNATVHNIGDDNASQVVVRFHDGPPSGSNQIGSDQIIPFISYLGGTGVASVLWTAGPPGMHDICVVADPDNLVMEWNETNNMACVPIEVIGAPPRPPTNLSAVLSGKDSQNVTLTWDSSPDDGGGSSNVVAYDIYRNTSFDSQGRGYVLYDSVPNGTSIHVDVLAGEGDPSDYFYYVCAVSNASLSSCTIIQAGKFTRPLSKGPNLVSIPLIQSNESIETILQTVEYDKAWYYDSLSKEWKWYMKYKGYRRGLFSINHTMGIWVNVTENSNLTVAGIVPAQTTIHLHEGWNLVSFPSVNISYSVGDMEASLPVQRLEGFDPVPPYFLRVLSDSDVLLAGRAYWVKVQADVEWIVTFE